MAFWEKIASRGNVDDRRAARTAVVGSVSLGGLAVMMLLNYLSGGDISDVLTQIDPSALVQQQEMDTSQFEGADEYEMFASTVLGSNDELWSVVFEETGRTYNPPKLVLFRSLTESECGYASSEVGPHYCSLDNTIYLDETFFEELNRRFGARGGDVAEAYVIAHEVGHHVQNELGTMGRVRGIQQSNPGRENELSIQMELQADCYAGMWAGSIRDQEVLMPGEIEEAMDAAAAVGDDRVQEAVAGYTNPESWTHGSSEQRVEWFTRGYEAETINVCDTLN